VERGPVAQTGQSPEGSVPLRWRAVVGYSLDLPAEPHRQSSHLERLNPKDATGMAYSFLAAEARGAGSVCPSSEDGRPPAGMSSVWGTAPAWSNPFQHSEKEPAPQNGGPVPLSSLAEPD
jgi:hypothetical protein